MLGAGPTLVVLNKADLAGFGAGGPIAVADRRAAEIQALTGVPTVPMVGLLAVAALDDELVTALHTLTAEPADLTSTDGFLSTGHSLPLSVRTRLLDTLDLFGIAHGVLALQQGSEAAVLPAVMRRLSQIDRVLARLAVVGAEVRYRRVRTALVQLARDGGARRTRAFRISVRRRSRHRRDGRRCRRGAGRRCHCRHRRQTIGASSTGAVLASLQPRTRQHPSPPLWRRHLPRLTEAAAACGGAVTDVDQAGDPVDAVDALVAGVDPGLSSPGVESRDVVLVTGPWLAGATGLIAALRDRLPEHEFVEAEDIRPAEAPAAVVFVVSAVAPIAESDYALIDLAAQHTDLVVGVVSKIDVHRNWRDVLAEDRTRLGAHAERYRDVPWVGVAATPDLGEPTVDELVELLRSRLDDVDVKRRNRLRAWESRLQNVISRHDKDGAGADRHARVTALRERRDTVQRERRVSKSERTIALRSQIQQARVQLAYFARNRCTSVRSELQEDASSMTRRRLPEFETYVGTRVNEVVGEVEAGITAAPFGRRDRTRTHRAAGAFATGTADRCPRRR